MDTTPGYSRWVIVIVFNIYMFQTAYGNIQSQFERFSTLSNHSCNATDLIYEKFGLRKVECVRQCVSHGSMCQGVFYQPSDGRCQVCNMMSSANYQSQNWSEAYARIGCQSEDFMVASVADDQLSDSTHYLNDDLYGAKYARLHTVETTYGDGAWSAHVIDQEQFIQVDFHEQRLITGVATQGRDLATNDQRVTEYRVLTSIDCVTFNYVNQDNDNPKLFPGNYDLSTVVSHTFDRKIIARCVRLNPTDWNEHISLRFDVIGCRI